MSWKLVANELLNFLSSANVLKQGDIYDADGIRVRQVMAYSAGALDYANYEFFPQYEMNIDGTVEIATKYSYKARYYDPSTGQFMSRNSSEPCRKIHNVRHRSRSTHVLHPVIN